MKKKKFKPIVKLILELITAILGIMIVSINDLNFRAVVVFIGAVVVFMVNCELLAEYGGYNDN